MNQKKNRKKLYIAVDFDGTIVRNKWPEIGPFRWMARPVLRWMKRRGHCLILYTCRECNLKLCGVENECCICNECLLCDAISAMEKIGISFDHINENAPERTQLYSGDCRKISADWYIDDLAGFLGWWSVPIIVWWLERKGIKSRRNRENE